MSLLRGAILLIAAAGAITCFPVKYLSADWQQAYYRWFGEGVAEEAPPGVVAPTPVLDGAQICAPDREAHAKAQTIAGVDIEAVDDCMPDNPYDVAVSVRGSNNVPAMVLMQSLYTPDTIEKSDDIDGDGDPDRIHIRLELIELNGHSPDAPVTLPNFEIAPGIAPGAGQAGICPCWRSYATIQSAA